MSRSGLSPAQNDLLRARIEEYLKKSGESQETLAPKLGFGSQSGLSSFLTRRAGTTYPTVEKLSKLVGEPEWELLGKPAPRMPLLPPRELAAVLARQIKVREAAIQSVLAVDPPPESEHWPALWWADEMRRRDLDMMHKARAHEVPLLPEPPQQGGETAGRPGVVRRPKRP
jgi:lambda repressor-like predicted transcriptional regulator